MARDPDRRKVIEGKIDSIEGEVGQEFHELQDIEKKMDQFMDLFESIKSHIEAGEPLPQLKEEIQNSLEACDSIRQEADDLDQKIENTEKDLEYLLLQIKQA